MRELWGGTTHSAVVCQHAYVGAGFKYSAFRNEVRLTAFFKGVIIDVAVRYVGSRMLIMKNT